MLIPFSTANTALNTDPRTRAAMPAGCRASASADFSFRNTLQQYPTGGADSRWGPRLNWYPQVSAAQVPNSCNPTAWAWARMQAAILQTISYDLNYCHHHAPFWTTPSQYRVWCDRSEPDTDQEKCSCSKAGSNKANAWRGVDCSSYTTYLFNYAFGYYPTSAIGSQACAATAPGRLLGSISSPSNLSLLAPGDLLFITPSRKGRAPPLRVSHVIMWTGWTVDFSKGSTSPLANATLVANLSASQRASTVACIDAAAAAGQPVYVITDSHHAGPALRPFCGWYQSSFSHARRVVNPDAGLYPDKNDLQVAYYDRTKGDCMSWWALQG